MKSGSLSKLTISNSAVDRVKETISNTHINGGIVIECFQINNRDVLSWPALKDNFEDYFATILTSDDFRKSVPELKIGSQLECETNFNFLSSFALDGMIASVIYNGGAYKAFDGTPREAKILAQELCNSIFGDRYPDVQVYVSNKPWSPWFYDVAWEYTWFILDTKLKRLWLICITDTD